MSNLILVLEIAVYLFHVVCLTLEGLAGLFVFLLSEQACLLSCGGRDAPSR